MASSSDSSTQRLDAHRWRCAGAGVGCRKGRRARRAARPTSEDDAMRAHMELQPEAWGRSHVHAIAVFQDGRWTLVRVRATYRDASAVGKSSCSGALYVRQSAHTRRWRHARSSCTYGVGVVKESRNIRNTLYGINMRGTPRRAAARAGSQERSSSYWCDRARPRVCAAACSCTCVVW